jgi:NAD(P)-dependent dehydrogenase (short-subunit alcohol dehydrogenase family)
MFDRTVALVSGAGQGIGRAVAERLLGAGCRVALTDVHQDTVDQAARALITPAQNAAAPGHWMCAMPPGALRWWRKLRRSGARWAFW